MDNLKVLENGLIPVYEGDKGQLVDDRELHSFLEVGTKFTDWIKERIERYGFVENEDFITTSEKREIAKSQSVEDLIIMQAQSMKDMRIQVQEAKEQSAAAGEAVQEIRDLIVISPQSDWREQTNKLVAKICKKLSSYNLPKEVIYKSLEARAKCDLKVRLENKIKRLIKEGMSKKWLLRIRWLEWVTQYFIKII